MKKLYILVIITLLSVANTFAQGDSCPGVAIPNTCTWYTGSNVGFTANTGFDDSYSAGDICALSLENTAWYSFTPTVTTTYDIIFTNLNCSGGGAAIQAGILSGPCGGPYSSLGCNTQPSGTNCFSIPGVSLTAGTTYYIVNDGDANAQCTWDINVCPNTCPAGGADVGTFTVTQNGSPVTSPIYLCEEGTDCLDFTSNDDYVLPPAFGCEIPEVVWEIHTGPTATPGNVGTYVATWSGEDFADCNLSTYGLDAINNGHVWLYPVTYDDGDNGGDPNGAIFHDQNGDGCWDMGTAIEVYYLDAISFSATPDPCLGTVDITISDGLPEVDASNYTVTNTGAGTLTGTPVSHGGTVTITGLTNGQNWSISVLDNNGCTTTTNGTFTGDSNDPSWTTPGTICEGDGPINLNSLITGTTGGTWSGTGVSGNTFNPSGLSGNIAVTYSVGPCPQTSVQNINVVPDVDPNWTNPSVVCANAGSINLNSLITGTTGGTWSGTGVSGNTFDPSSGTQSVTYTVGTAPCVETLSHTITVAPDVDPSWTTPGTVCENAGSINLNPLITGTTGGTWSGTGVSGNTFDPSGLSGNIAVTYSVGSAPCVETSVQNINVVPDVDPSWTTPGTVCENAGSINLNPLITGTTGGTWSGTGVTGNTFDPTGLSGNIAVTYTVGSAPCVETSVQNINVVPNVDPSWTTPGTVCENAGGINLNPIITGTTGGTWSGTGVSGNTFDPSGLSGNIAVTYTVGSGSCVETSVQNINVVPDVDPSWTNPSTICENAGSINLNSLITGTTGGTWSGTGVSGNMFDPSSGTQSVTYSVGSAPCVETLAQTITVAPDVDPSWTTPGTICENAGTINLNSLITGTTGGTWSGTGVTGNTFDPTGLSGNIAVTYSVGSAPCVETSVQNINVIPDVDPSWTNPSTICASAGSINLNSLITGTTGGTWSGTGVSGNTFDPSSGTQSVTYSVGTAPCVETLAQTITVAPDVDPSWTTPGTLCENAGTINLNSLITGTTGGTWSGTGVTGNTFDPTGLSGNIAVTYSVGSAPCVETSVQNINVIPDVDPSWTNPGPICEGGGTINLNSSITGTTGGTWSGTGVTGNTFDPAGLSGVINVTYTVGTAPCVESLMLGIQVDPEDDPSFTYSSGTFCITGTDPLPTSITTPGGTFTITAPGVIDPTTGEIDLTSSGLGSYTVYYNTAVLGNLCPNIDSLSVTITSAPSAAFSYDLPQYCQDSAAPILTFGPGAGGGVFSSSPSGLALNTGTGAVDLTTSTPGVYTVYNTIAASGGCAAAIDSTSIEVLQVDSADFSYGSATFCITGSDPTAVLGTNTTAGGVFTIIAPGSINAADGTIDLATSGIGTFTVYYNTPSGNACPAVDSVTVDIVNAPGASFTYNTPFCEGDTATTLPSFPANNFAGTFSAVPVGISFVNVSTGEIDLTSSTAGVYMVYNNLAASGGCAAAVDSFQVTINPMFMVQINDSICQGDSILLGGAYQNSAGTYTDSLLTTLGCDSIIETTLFINPIVTTPQNAAICSGDSIILAGAYQTTGGVYYDTIPSSLGCDSIIETTLTVNSLIVTNVNDTICQGDSILLEGAFQTVAGVYYDTLQASGGCDSVLTTNLTVNPQLSIVAMNDTTICSSAQLILTAAASGSGTVNWYSDAAGTNSIGTGNPLVVANPGQGVHTYYVNETGGSCPSITDSVVVTVGGVTAVINATPSSGAIPLNVNLDGTNSIGNVTGYDWDFGNGGFGTQGTESTVYNDLGEYTVTLIVTDGTCSDTVTIVIDAFGESVLVIPNVFTPNGDGQNDVFTVDGENLESVDCEIYNRWGQLMYSWDNVGGHWDGRTLSGSEAPDGTYFYIINAVGVDGTEYFKKGGFSLIR